MHPPVLALWRFCRQGERVARGLGRAGSWDIAGSISPGFAGLGACGREHSEGDAIVKALRTSGERQVDVLDLPVPHPEPGEVVIQMKSTGICGSDLHPYRHPTPQHLDPGFISGHEPCGVIAAVGAGVSEVEGVVGQRVMNHHYKGCGQCKHCRVGWSQLCKKGIEGTELAKI